MSPDKTTLFATLIQNARDVITLINPEGIIEFQSDSVASLFGYAPGELLGHSIFSYLHPDDVEEALAALQRTTDAVEDNPRLLCRIRHKEGDWRFVEVVGQLVNESGIEGVMLHARDVTSQQVTIRELRASEEMFEAAFNATEAICTMTLPETGEYIDVNDAFLNATGWRREEVLGRTALDLKIWGGDDNRRKLMAKLAQDGELKAHRSPIYTRTGEVRSMLIDAKYLHLQDTTRIFMSAIDITEQEEAEARLRQSQKLEAIGQLTGGIAHDFNNMLSVIIGHAELAEVDHAAGRDIDESIGAILRAAKSGAELIQHMLAFSRKQSLQPVVFNIAARLQSLAPLLQTTVGKSISLELPDNDEALFGNLDPAQFDAAILNLVINARDAIADAGVISLALRHRTLGPPAARLEEVPPGHYVELTVTDTGRGMAVDLLDRVFEPFFTTKQQEGGTGLGLSMVFGYLKQSGGAVKLESTPGEGTSVHLLVPAVAAPVAQGEKDIPANDLSHLHVLLVEDSPEVRTLVADMLRTMVADVTVAESGADITPESARNADLLLTDVMLSGGQRGPQVAKQLREERPSLPVVFMTGYAEGHLSELGEYEGFLQKPFTLEELKTEIIKVLKS